MSLSSHNISQLPETDFRKCGILLVAPKRNAFAMSCLFCENRFMRLPAFLRHLHQAHMEELEFEDEMEVYAVEELVNRTLSLAARETDSEESGVAEDEDLNMTENEEDKDIERQEKINMGEENTNSKKKETNNLRKPHMTLANMSILNALEDCDVSFNLVENLNNTLIDKETIETDNENDNSDESIKIIGNAKSRDYDGNEVMEETYIDLDSTLLRNIQKDLDLKTDNLNDNKNITKKNETKNNEAHEEKAREEIFSIERPMKNSREEDKDDEEYNLSHDEDLNVTLTEDNMNKILNKSTISKSEALKNLLNGIEDLEDVDDFLDNLDCSIVSSKPKKFEEKLKENFNVVEETVQENIIKPQESTRVPEEKNTDEIKLKENASEPEEDDLDNFQLNASIVRQCLADDDEEEISKSVNIKNTQKEISIEKKEKKTLSALQLQLMSDWDLDDVEMDECCETAVDTTISAKPRTSNGWDTTPKTSMVGDDFNNIYKYSNNSVESTESMKNVDDKRNENVERNKTLENEFKTTPSTKRITGDISELTPKTPMNIRFYTVEETEINDVVIPHSENLKGLQDRKESPKFQESKIIRNIESLTPKVQNSRSPKIIGENNSTIKQETFVENTNKDFLKDKIAKPIQPEITSVQEELEDKTFDDGLSEDNSSTRMFIENTKTPEKLKENSPEKCKEYEIKKDIEKLNITQKLPKTNSLQSLLNKDLDNEEDLDLLINQLESGENDLNENEKDFEKDEDKMDLNDDNEDTVKNRQKDEDDTTQKKEVDLVINEEPLNVADEDILEDEMEIFRKLVGSQYEELEENSDAEIENLVFSLNQSQKKDTSLKEKNHLTLESAKEKNEEEDDFEQLLNEDLSKALENALGDENDQIVKLMGNEVTSELKNENISVKIENDEKRLKPLKKIKRKIALKKMDEKPFKSKYNKTNQKAKMLQGKPIKSLTNALKETNNRILGPIKEQNVAKKIELEKKCEQQSLKLNAPNLLMSGQEKLQTAVLKPNISPESIPKAMSMVDKENHLMTPKSSFKNKQETNSVSTPENKEEIHFKSPARTPIQKTPKTNLRNEIIMNSKEEINTTRRKNNQNSPLLTPKSTPTTSPKSPKTNNKNQINSPLNKQIKTSPKPNIKSDLIQEKHNENPECSMKKIQKQKTPTTRRKNEKVLNDLNDVLTPEKNKNDQQISPSKKYGRKTPKSSLSLNNELATNTKAVATPHRIQNHENSILQSNTPKSRSFAEQVLNPKNMKSNFSPPETSVITNKSLIPISRCFINTQRGERTPMKLNELFLKQSPKSQEKIVTPPQLTPDFKIIKKSQSECKKALNKSISPKPTNDLNKSPTLNGIRTHTRRATSIPPGDCSIGVKTPAKLREVSVKLHRWSSQQSLDPFANPKDLKSETNKPSMLSHTKEEDLGKVFQLPSGITISKVGTSQDAVTKMVEITPSRSNYCKQNFTEQQIEKSDLKNHITSKDICQSILNNLPSSLIITKTNPPAIGERMRSRQASIDIVPSTVKSPKRCETMDYKSYAINRSARKNVVLQRMRTIKKQIFKPGDINKFTNAKLKKSPLPKKAKRSAVEIKNVEILPIIENISDLSYLSSPLLNGNQITKELKITNKSPEKTQKQIQNAVTAVNSPKIEIIKPPETSPKQPPILENKTPPKDSIKAPKTPTTGRRGRRTLKRAASPPTGQEPHKRKKSPSAENTEELKESQSINENLKQSSVENINEPNNTIPKSPVKYKESNGNNQNENKEPNDILVDLLEQVTNEECPKKNQKEEQKIPSNSIVEDYDESKDQELLHKFGIKIISINDIEDFHTIEEVEEMRALAKKFSNICASIPRLFTCSKATDYVGMLKTLYKRLNSSFQENITVSDVKRLINLIILWYSNCCNSKLIDKKPFSDSTNIYLQIFNFIPKTAKRIYFCEFCDENFRAEHKYFTHRMQHTGDKFPYKCKKCSNGFLRAISLKTHSQVCNQIALLAKQPDNSTVKNEPNIGMNKKMDIKTYSNNLQNTPKEQTVKRRLKTVYKCAKCDVGFGKESEVRQHVASCNSFPRRLLKATPRPKPLA